MGVHLYVICYFPLVVFNILSLCLIFAVWLLCVSVCSSLFLSCLQLCASWIWWTTSFPKLQSVAVCNTMLSRVWLLQPMDYCPLIFHHGLSSVHRIFYARIPECTAIYYTMGSSWPRHQTRVSCVSCTASEFFTAVPPGKPWCDGSSQLLSLQIIFQVLSLSLLFLGPLQWECWCILCCPRCPLCHLHFFFFLFLFSIFYFGAVIPTILSSMSIICSSVSVFCYWFLPVYCSSLFGLRQPSLWLYRVYGRANGDLQEGLRQEACPRSSAASDSHLRREPLLTHTSTGDPPILAGRFGSVSCGVTVPFPWVLLHVTFYLCPPRVESVSPSPAEVL